MSDLRPEDRIVSSKTDGLSEYVCGLVNRWEQRRDVTYRDKWSEYRRMWMGEWAAQDRDRASERSKAIMPAIQQAVDSAVSEVEEAMFGQERWFDVASDDPSTEADEGGPGRQVADRLLMDLKDTKAAVSQCALMGAIYGTGIGKIVIREAVEGINLELVPVQPLEFVIDPAAETIDEAQGVAHVFTLPYSVVLERQRQGIYAKVDPRIGVEPGDERHVDADVVRIIEYQGLVPAGMLPDVSDGREKLRYEDDLPVEAIVTVANDDVVLRAVENPLINRDRGFIAFQWDTVPGHFWGRGIVEKGYWPQKVLDAEVRARIDALAFSVHPMMAVNASMVPRNADFAVRPGRNIFLNGSPSEALQPIQFPPPDPQTYVQGQEMQRMIEMATGQLQAATPFGVNGRNETASGMSMMLGASIRRTRRTMANIERSFMKPFLRKAIDRFQQFDMRYPEIPIDFRVHGTLGMMAREFESMQLTQLLNALPPGAAQFALLRAVVDNTGITNKAGILQLLDVLTAQALEPQEPPRDLGGEARMLSAQAKLQELAHKVEMDQTSAQLEQLRLELQASESQRAHQRDVMRISVDAERAEQEGAAKAVKSLVDVVESEQGNSELAQQLIDALRSPGPMVDLSDQVLEALEEVKALKAQTPEKVDLSEIMQTLNRLENKSKASDPDEGITIERDETTGLVRAVNGRRVERDPRGLIVSVEGAGDL